MNSIIAFGAHPDDIELGCGGTELILRDRGYAITHVCVTSGGAGSNSIAPETLCTIREAEAERAARHVGARLELLRLTDGAVEVTPAVQHQVIALLRAQRPTAVFVHASDDSFDDHAKVHRLVVDAVTAAAGPWFASAGEPYRVPNFFGYEVWHPLRHPGWVVDISATLGRKLEMLACHASQMQAVDYCAAASGLAHYRGVMTLMAKAAEVFEILRCEPAL